MLVVYSNLIKHTLIKPTYEIGYSVTLQTPFHCNLILSQLLLVFLQTSDITGFTFHLGSTFPMIYTRYLFPPIQCTESLQGVQMDWSLPYSLLLQWSLAMKSIPPCHLILKILAFIGFLFKLDIKGSHFLYVPLCLRCTNNVCFSSCYFCYDGACSYMESVSAMMIYSMAPVPTIWHSFLLWWY